MMTGFQWLIIFLFFVIAFTIYMNWSRISGIIFSNEKSDTKASEYICPKCGSDDVRLDTTNPVVWAYGTQSRYKCNNCGYISYLFPLVDKDAEGKVKKEIKEEISSGFISSKRSSKVDTSTAPVIPIEFGVSVVALSVIGFIGFLVSLAYAPNFIVLLMSIACFLIGLRLLHFRQKG